MKREFPREISRNVWQLCNKGYPIFLVTGSKACAFVEGSLSCMADEAVRQMESIKPDAPLKYLVVAHSHSDHVCGFMKLLETRPDLILTGSKGTAHVLAKENVIRHFIDEDRMFGAFLMEAGLWEIGPQSLEAKPMSFDLMLDDMETLDLGGVSLQAIDSPGHAPGAQSYMTEPDKTLFISDAAGIADDKARSYPLFFHSFRDYIETLNRLKHFKPERLVLAHDLVVEGKEESLDFLDRAVKAAYEMKKDMAEQSKNGVPDEVIALRWATRMRVFGVFDHFPDEALCGYTRLLLRRALEA